MNWFERIEAAVARGGKFTAADVEAALGWPTCACGEQDPEIPRDYVGAPQDRHLWLLGGDFNIAVRTDDPQTALMLLLAIEDRAAEILRGEP